MGQQISMDDAFPIVERRCVDLFKANLLLEAKANVLERQLAAALEENARLRQGTPGGAGPNLAAMPPYLSADDSGGEPRQEHAQMTVPAE